MRHGWRWGRRRCLVRWQRRGAAADVTPGSSRSGHAFAVQRAALHSRRFVRSFPAPAFVARAHGFVMLALFLVEYGFHALHHFLVQGAVLLAQGFPFGLGFFVDLFQLLNLLCIQLELAFQPGYPAISAFFRAHGRGKC